MSMKDDSVAMVESIETHEERGGACGGAVKKTSGVSRRLRSTKDARVKITVVTAKPEKAFDPTAWYVAEVKRHCELKSRDVLNKPGNFPFPVEAYAATPSLLLRKSEDSGALKAVKEKIIIHGKIFIRIADKSRRIDVLKGCPYIKRYVKDASLDLTESGFTEFARVPDLQIQRLQKLLALADGPVEYTDASPEVHDQVQVIGGQLSKARILKDLKGEITMTNGRKYATVILDTLGCFKFRLPVKDLAKLSPTPRSPKTP